jgi:hypothetical protein
MVIDAPSWFDDVYGSDTRDKGKGVSRAVDNVPNGRTTSGMSQSEHSSSSSSCFFNRPFPRENGHSHAHPHYLGQRQSAPDINSRPWNPYIGGNGEPYMSGALSYCSTQGSYNKGGAMRGETEAERGGALARLMRFSWLRRRSSAAGLDRHNRSDSKVVVDGNSLAGWKLRGRGKFDKWKQKCLDPAMDKVYDRMTWY